MALETNVILETGVEVTYFKVSKNIFLNCDDKIAQVFLLGFKDADAKNEGLKPIIVMQVEIKNEKIEVVNKRPLTLEEIKYALPLEAQIKFEGKGDAKMQVNLTNEELLEAGKDLTADVTTIEDAFYFDDFYAFFNKGKYIDGIYNHVKTHPKFIEFLGKTIDV